MPPITQSATGNRIFKYTDVSLNGFHPHIARSEIVTVIKNTIYTQCGGQTAMDVERFLRNNWILYQGLEIGTGTSTATSFTLPILPDSWPNAATGGLEPITSYENYYEWDLEIYRLGLPGYVFDYRHYDLADRRRNMTQIVSNRVRLP